MHKIITLAGCSVPLYSLKANSTASPEAENASDYQDGCHSAVRSFSVQTENVIFRSLHENWMLLLLSGHPEYTVFRPHLHFLHCRVNQTLPPLQHDSKWPQDSTKPSGLVRAAQLSRGWHQHLPPPAVSPSCWDCAVGSQSLAPGSVTICPWHPYDEAA